ncbi:MAG: DUF5331 domain-containing protein [Leptolyngbyaceae cyanobacterium bins.59]|nr:DUF5331 domain-containing protein [Leptolyngbyaceae cyanobacterium bins.59]
MNVDELRQSLKLKWLTYYRENRAWVTRIGIWVTHKGQRRPSSSFILATLSVLEPELTQVLPLIVEFSNSPDRVIEALGLNFNPDEAMKSLESTRKKTMAEGTVRLLPSGTEPIELPEPAAEKTRTLLTDEACRGTRADS